MAASIEALSLLTDIPGRWPCSTEPVRMSTADTNPRPATSACRPSQVTDAGAVVFPTKPTSRSSFLPLPLVLPRLGDDLGAELP